MRASKRTRTDILTALTLTLGVLGAAPAFAEDVFDVTLAPCTAALCGEDSSAILREGRIEVSKRGEVEVDLDGAEKNVELCVVFQPVPSGDPITVGSVRTGDRGYAYGDAGTLEVEDAFGYFLLRQDDCESGAPLYATLFSTFPSDGGPGRDDDDDDDGGEFDDDDEGAEFDDDDGAKDDDDDDSDRDGVKDDDDADPDRSNGFDGADDRRELRDEYRDDLRQEREEFREERKELIDDYREKLREMRDDYRERRREL